jgi:hypothetical protein
MRDYTLTQSASFAGSGLAVFGMIAKWRARRRFENLCSEGSELPGCPGATKDDIGWALALPAGQDPLMALERRLLLRSRHPSAA